MKKKYQSYLLITDMDGTLLNSQKEISRENLDAIWDFVNGGGKFGVATGRSPGSAKRWLLQLPINCPCIFYNGSMVKDIATDTVLACQHLEKDCLFPQMEWVLQNSPETVVEIFTPQGLFLVSNPVNKDPYLEQEQDPYTHASLSHVKDLPWIKILLCAKHEALQKIEQHVLAEADNNHFNYCYSTDFYLEFLPCTTKGSALSVLCETTHGQGRKIIAVGDYENDIAMLRQADIGIAVGNALPIVKDNADSVVSDNNHHAIAEVISLIALRGEAGGA